MHYCFLTAGSWETNASYVRVRELGGELYRRGNKVTFIVNDSPAHRAMKFPVGADVVYIPTAKRAGLSRRSAIVDLNPAYLHVLAADTDAVAALSYVPTQRVVGDWDDWPAKWDLKGWGGFRVRFMDRRLRKRAKITLVASRYLFQEFTDLGCKPIYLPNAAHPAPEVHADSPYKSRTFVYYGTLESTGDHDVIFTAAEQLRNAGSYPNIDIIGGGAELPRLKEHVRKNQLSNVLISGALPMDEVRRRLRFAHAILLPVRDNLSNRSKAAARLFTVAAGRRPVITTRVGEIPEILGDNAMYIDCTPESFGQAITDQMKSKLPDVDHDLEKHNWPDRAQQLLNAITALDRR